jgi:hypothetical protein
MNWKSNTTPKFNFGLTIDPVRIQSLKEVCSEEEYAIDLLNMRGCM